MAKNGVDFRFSELQMSQVILGDEQKYKKGTRYFSYSDHQ